MFLRPQWWVLVALTAAYALHTPAAAQEIIWKAANGPSSVSVYDMAFVGSQEIYAAADAGIFYSEDQGSSWDLVVESRILDPYNSYPTVTSIQSESDGLLYAGGAFDVFVSRDRGKNWERAIEESFGRVIDIVVDSNGYLYAAFETAILRKAPGDEQWNNVAPIGPVHSVYAGFDGRLYVGGINANYTSDDRGDSWRLLDGMGQTSVVDWTMDSTGQVFVASDRGAFRYVSSTNTWESIPELSEVHPTHPTSAVPNVLAIEAFDGDRMLASSGRRLWLSLDSGRKWTPVDSSRWGYFAVSFIGVHPGGALFVAVEQMGLLRSDDGGMSWVQANEGLSGAHVREIAFDELDRIIVGESNGNRESRLFRFDAADAHWERIGWNGESPGYHIFGLAVRGDTILVGSERAVMYSPDAGLSWISSREGAMNWPAGVTDLGKFGATVYGVGGDGIYATDDLMFWQWQKPPLYFVFQLLPTQGGRMYAADMNGLMYSDIGESQWHAVEYFAETVFSVAEDATGRIFAGTVDGIHRSTDRGKTWERVLETSARVRVLAVTADDQLFAGVGWAGELFRSVDGGETWSIEKAGLPVSAVASIAFDAKGIAYVGTLGRGLYTSSASVSLAREAAPPLHSAFTIESIFPNPVDRTSTVRLHVPRTAHVELSVHDLQGRRVVDVISRTLDAGVHELSWQADLPSGIYFCRATSSGLTATRVVVVVR